VCSKVEEDGANGQNTRDFLLVVYSNFGRISALYSRFYSKMTLPGDCDLSSDSESQYLDHL